MTPAESPRKPPKRVQPFVAPGKQLRFVERLETTRQWPPPRGRIERSGNTPTPFLILQAFPADAGDRPLLPAGAAHLSEFFRNSMIQFPSVRLSPAVAAAPQAGHAFELSCEVLNTGANAAYAGIAEFYIGAPWTFSSAAASGGALVPFGRASFTAMPGQAVTVRCPKAWTPTSASAFDGVLVQAYDMLLDPVHVPFDWRTDRHVARLDFYADLVGQWVP